MKLTRVPIANPTVMPIKMTVVIMGAMSAIVALGIALKSNGNIDSKARTVAIPNRFKMIRVVSRSRYLSKIISRMCPVIDRVNVIVRIGSQALKSSVRIGYLTHLVVSY